MKRSKKSNRDFFEKLKPAPWKKERAYLFGETY